MTVNERNVLIRDVLRYTASTIWFVVKWTLITAVIIELYLQYVA